MKKHRILSGLLAFVLVLALLPTAALAAESMNNFQKTNTYAPGTFTDVPASEWYAGNVQTAYEIGLVMGTSDTEFSPGNNIDLASTLVLACRLHSIYYNGSAYFAPGNP